MVVPIIAAEAGVAAAPAISSAAALESVQVAYYSTAFLAAIVAFAEQHPELSGKAKRVAWYLFLLWFPVGPTIWLMGKDEKYGGRRNYETLKQRFDDTWVKIHQDDRSMQRAYAAAGVPVSRRPLSQELETTLPPLEKLEQLLNKQVEKEQRRAERPR